MIAGGADARDERVRSSYDAIATAYADHLVDELAGLPFETWLLDRVVARAAGQPVVELGSGPGHVTAYLADRGTDATGIDLSEAIVAEARRRFPTVTFQVGDLRRLTRPAASSGWAAVLAWYSLPGVVAAAEKQRVALPTGQHYTRKAPEVLAGVSSFRALTETGDTEVLNYGTYLAASKVDPTALRFLLDDRRDLTAKVWGKTQYAKLACFLDWLAYGKA